jgi:hypothetical protein
MKKLFFVSIFLAAILLNALGQSAVKATIHLKDGKVVEAYHFGKLKCESNAYASTFTTLKGKFNGNHTEISDYKDISKLELSGFTASPVPSVGNQKGSIIVLKKNGVSVKLDEAELAMSCYNPADRYNEIHVQVVNPLNDKKADIAIAMKDIVSISF